MKQPSLLLHLRDILILPFTVTVIVPYFILEDSRWTMMYDIVIRVGGYLFLTGGVMLLFYTIFLFRTRGKGTLAPWAPTQKLIVTGPYRYCRNPMITGVFFVLLGETMVFGSVNLLIWTGVFFLINTVYFIFKEEPDMYRRFGEDYRVYKENVPRWIPRFTPYQNT